MRYNHQIKRQLTWYLVIFFSFVPAWPTPVGASFIPSQDSLSSSNPSVRQEDLQKIQALLEKKIISKRLKELGLTPEEVTKRVSQLNDKEMHQIASRIEELQAGGSGWTDVFWGLVAFFVVIGLIGALAGEY